jgi:hypothetical protein
MMECEQMVQDMVCVYNEKSEQFHTIVRVGRDVCGYPKTVHGGLTAAIADETFGGTPSRTCEHLMSVML